MADNEQSSVDVQQPTPPQSASQLKYPQLLIDASFESLLSHSHSSDTRTVVPMPRSEHSLSESWSSLSEHDLTHDPTHDDDLTSDITDTGSLIDVNTAEDVHSVDDQAQSSDADEDTQGDEDIYNCGDKSEQIEHDYVTRKLRSSTARAHPMVGMRLEDSAVVVDPNGITSLQASRVLQQDELLSYSTHLGSNADPQDVMVTIKMSMSSDPLRVVKRPYNVLFYESPFTSSEIKSDVLGKIGAALITSGDCVKLDETSEPPCYHVVPSEFGPGSRPSTADLIPIPIQMHVTDCVVLGKSTNHASDRSIRLGLSTGKVVTSREAKLFETVGKRHWMQPDLAVIVVSQHEDRRSQAAARSVVEFASRHGIAVLCLRQESGWDSDDFLTDAAPTMLHKIVQSMHELEDGNAGRKMLIDVDMFRLLDTEQLSQHLNFISRLGQTAVTSNSTLSQRLQSQLYKNYLRVVERLPNAAAQHMMTNDRGFDVSRWVTETSSKHPADHRRSVRGTQKTESVQGADMLTNVLSAVRNGAASLLVTAIVVLFMYASQAGLSRFMPAKTPTIQSTSPNEFSAASCSFSTLTTSTTTALASATQANALSGPLHALEQMQSWMELHTHIDKKAAGAQQHKDSAGQSKRRDTAACVDIVSAYISPNLKVDAEFFNSGEPAFAVQVRRGEEKVPARLEKQTDGTAVVMVKRKDFHGQLLVHLDSPVDKVCATVDLENSLSETLALWMQNSERQNSKLRNAKELSNRYVRLLEVRTSKPGFVSGALELHYSAVQSIGAAVEAVEKTAIKHAKVCHQDRSHCIVPSMDTLAKDISDSVRHARHASEDLIHHARNNVMERTKETRDRADRAIQQARYEISKAVAAIRPSIKDISKLGKGWPGKMTETLAEAQQRAQQLVRKQMSGSGRKSRRDPGCKPGRRSSRH